jgi:AraC-like DNA-binding protein
MISTAEHGAIRALSGEAPASARIACTDNVRIEYLRCPSAARLHWSIPCPAVSLLWVRDRSGNARIKVAGAGMPPARPGRANFWFFPEGIGAEGELSADAPNDCVGVFVQPGFIPSAVKQDLAEPITGFAPSALGRAFNELTGELTEPNEMMPLFTEGWAMQALAYVARAARDPRPQRTPSMSGLAPWQLRRAKEMLQADLSVNLSLDGIAGACRLSVSHFARAFKHSTGLPPHQWLINARIEQARTLLAKSTTPLVEIAGMCGFADQSHFSRVFGRSVGASPGAWRRAQMV